MFFTEFYILGLQNLAKFRFSRLALNSLQIKITQYNILGVEDIKDVQARSIMSMGVEVGPKRCKIFCLYHIFPRLNLLVAFLFLGLDNDGGKFFQ